MQVFWLRPPVLTGSILLPLLRWAWNPGVRAPKLPCSNPLVPTALTMLPMEPRCPGFLPLPALTTRPPALTKLGMKPRHADSCLLFLAAPQGGSPGPGVLGGLAVGNVTSDSFGLAWTMWQGLFDSFLVLSQDMAGQAGSQEVQVPGDQRATLIQGLHPATAYAVTLYGVHQGRLSRPLRANVSTGSVVLGIPACTPTLLLLLYPPSLLAFISTMGQNPGVRAPWLSLL